MTKPMTNLPPDEEIDFVNSQITQAIESLRTELTLTVQILTVFVVANATMIGFSVSSQKSGIVFVAALIPLMMLIIIRGISKFMLPIIYTAITLETKFGRRNTDWLSSTFMAIAVSPEFVKNIQRMSQIDDYYERIAKLRKLKLELIDRPHFRLILMLIIIAQITGGIILTTYFGWKLF